MPTLHYTPKPIKMDHGPNIMKLLELLGKYLSDLWVSKDFLWGIQKPYKRLHQNLETLFIRKYYKKYISKL